VAIFRNDTQNYKLLQFEKNGEPKIMS